MLATLIPHTLIHPEGKIKSKNFHMFDIHWLYRSGRHGTPSLRLMSLNVTTSLNVAALSSQYGGCLCNRSDCIFFFFFFFLFDWVLRSFQEYFTYIEPIVHRRWAKTGEPTIIKKLLSEMKGLQEKESILGVRGRQKNPSLAITVWHHSAILIMPDSDPRS